MHCAVVWFAVTTHPVAVYPTPPTPYFAVMGLPTHSAPKFVPVSVSVVAPLVGIELPPTIAEIDGAVKFNVVVVHQALVPSDVVVCTPYSVPTPTGVMQVIIVVFEETEQLVAKYAVEPPLLLSATYTDDPMIPMFVPVMLS